MNMKKSLLAIAFVAMAFVSCKKKETTTDGMDGVNKDTMTMNHDGHSHTSENSLDWAGTYKGTLPCADCEGIETVITLNKDETFTHKATYMGAKAGTEKTTFDDKGTIMWHDGSIVHLKGKDTDVKLKVAENKLIQLDQEGNEIDGALKEHYVLTKQ